MSELAAPNPDALSYQLEVASPAAVREDLLRIWRANLPLETEAEEKFRWLYERAPHPAGHVLMLSAVGGGATERVGAAGYGVRRFALHSTLATAALMGDLGVDRRHRTALPGLTLVRGARDHALRTHAFAYGFPNHRAEPVFRRAGYTILGRMVRFVRVLRHASYVQRMMPMPVLPAIAGAVLDGARLIAPTASRIAGALGGRLETFRQAEEVDDRFDRLWREARSSYRVVGERSAAFLRWRFLERPGVQAEIVALSGYTKGASLSAYAVIERAGETAYVRDLFGHTAALDRLLPRLVLALSRAGCASIGCRILPNRRLDALLVRHGFVPRTQEDGRAVALCLAPAGPLTASPLGAPDAWHLTDADEDV
jgi:hypothetical protein